jgi:hypothetical protein
MENALCCAVCAVVCEPTAVDAIDAAIGGAL